MATTTIPWSDGSGDNIYLTYSSASGDQTVEVSSDANGGPARSKVVTFTSGVGSITQQLTVNQGAGGTQIPYIRNTTVSAYIDTGITPNQTTRMIVWARNLNPYAYAWLFGSRVSGSSNGFSVCAPNGADTGKIRLQFGNNGANSGDAFKYLSGYHKYELNAGKLYVDDVQVASVSSSNFSNSHNIHLFGLNNNGGHASASVVIDICAAKIYKGGSLVRDFTPVQSPSVGMYDAVSGTVFTNAGSGSFTYGTFNPNDYIPLEYISCGNSQWFDSGVKGSYSRPIVVKYMPTSTTKTWRGLLGVFSTTNSESCGFTLGNTSNANYQLSFRLGPNTTDVVVANYTETNKAMVLVKSNNTATLYENGTQRGTKQKTGVDTAFTTNLTMTIGGTRNTSTTFSDNKFYGRFYYVGLGSLANFVPAKVSGVAGMYDTYNDVFYSSESDVNFTAGPEL